VEIATASAFGVEKSQVTGIMDSLMRQHMLDQNRSTMDIIVTPKHLLPQLLFKCMHIRLNRSKVSEIWHYWLT